MVGGVVADVYSAEHRGQGMNILGLVVFLGQVISTNIDALFSGLTHQALGGAIFGWVGPAVGLRWSYGVSGKPLSTRSLAYGRSWRSALGFPVSSTLVSFGKHEVMC